MKKFKKPEFKLLKEFKAFITKGNVVDLAVGMIIGAAFTAIVTALVNNIFKPLINAIPMGDLQGLITMLVAKNAEGLTAAECAQKGVEFVVDMTKSVYIDWGAFIMAIINFLITALVLLQWSSSSIWFAADLRDLDVTQNSLNRSLPKKKPQSKAKLQPRKNFAQSRRLVTQRQNRRRQKRLQKQKQRNPKPLTTFSVKFATFSKRNNFKTHKNLLKTQALTLLRRTKNKAYFVARVRFRYLSFQNRICFGQRIKRLQIEKPLKRAVFISKTLRAHALCARLLTLHEKSDIL